MLHDIIDSPIFLVLTPCNLGGGYQLASVLKLVVLVIVLFVS